LYKPLGKILSGEALKGKTAGDIDVKFFVQEWLRRRLRTDNLRCEVKKEGEVIIYVGGFTEAQMAEWLGFEVQEAVKEQWPEVKIKELKVIQQW
jgi:hypothetical protein